MNAKEAWAQIDAAAIREKWVEANPPPLRKNMRSAVQWNRTWSDYLGRWQASPEFAECQRIMAEALTTKP